MSLHVRYIASWRAKLAIMVAVICLLLGVAAVCNPPAAMAATGNCYVPHYKTSGTGSAKHPCNYNEHAYAYQQPLQYRTVRYYNRSGQSVMVSYVEGYTDNYTPAEWPWASEFHTAFYIQITRIWCLNSKTLEVKCGYLNIGMVEHDHGKGYRTSFNCKSKRVCGYYTSGGSFAQGPVWDVGGGSLQKATKHMAHFGGLYYVSGVVDGHYVPSNYKVLGHRYSYWWRATVRVDY